MRSAVKRRVVWADGMPGFGIRVSPKGTKSFVLKFDVEGQDRWITFGRYPKLTLAGAFQKYALALEKIERGEDPASESVQGHKADQNALTVRKLADEYIEKYAKPRKRSWKQDKRALDHDVLGPWGARKASKITRRDVINLLDEIVARGAPVQANRTLAVIRRMFNFAFDRDLLSASPCYRIKPPSLETPKDRYLTLDEIRAFWKGLETAPLSTSTKLVLGLLLLTLQRSTEVIGLNTSELDLQAGTWVIPAARTKNKRTHLVPLSPPALAIVNKLLAIAKKETDNVAKKQVQSETYLLPGRTGKHHLSDAVLSKAVARNLKHFKIGKFTPHDLRRTGSTQLAAFKVPRFDRDRILNHTDASIGSVYDLYDYEDEKRAALNLWADIITEAAESKNEVDVRALQNTLKYQDYFPE